MEERSLSGKAVSERLCEMGRGQVTRQKLESKAEFTTEWLESQYHILKKAKVPEQVMEHVLSQSSAAVKGQQKVSGSYPQCRFQFQNGDDLNFTNHEHTPLRFKFQVL